MRAQGRRQPHISPLPSSGSVQALRVPDDGFGRLIGDSAREAAVASALGCGLKLHALLFHLAIGLPVLLLLTCKQAATSAQSTKIPPCFLSI